MNIIGPHLIITPLAVLQNWANEITRFAPDLSFKKLYGSQVERDYLMSDEDVLSGRYDVYLTTYETVMNEEPFFTDTLPWATVTVDEGHRLKGDSTKLRATLSRLSCPVRVLLTGTPLQNNLHVSSSVTISAHLTLCNTEMCILRNCGHYSTSFFQMYFLIQRYLTREYILLAMF